MKTPPRVGSYLVEGILCSCGGRLEGVTPERRDVASVYRCPGEACQHRGQEVVVIGMRRVLLYPATTLRGGNAIDGRGR